MEEKEELIDLNQRFITYVHRVRQLKDETDVKKIYQAMEQLEIELKSLKSTYETQIAQLRNKVEYALREKIEIERSFVSKKNSETHLLDRLNVESSKNIKIMQDIHVLNRELQDKEHKIKASQNEIKQAWIDYGDLKNKFALLELDLEQANERIKELEQTKSEN